MDGDLCIEILEDDLQSSLAIYDKTPQGIIFQQDNDPKLLQTGLLKTVSGVTKSIGGVVGGTWLQLMCCILPKHLCP